MKKEGEEIVKEKRGRWKIFFKSIFVFFTIYFAAAAVIQIDEAASSAIGNESFFSSHFIRTGEREVDVKIMGFQVRIISGLIVFDE